MMNNDYGAPRKAPAEESNSKQAYSGFKNAAY
jgi:hypothetical protein